MKGTVFTAVLLMLAWIVSGCSIPNYLPGPQPTPQPPSATQPASAPAGQAQTPQSQAPGGQALNTAPVSPYRTSGVWINTAYNRQYPFTVYFISARRISGNILDVRLAISNEADSKLPTFLAFGPGFGDIYLVDPAEQKKYEVLKEENLLRDTIASKINEIPAKQRVEIFMHFPAPPPTTSRVHIYVPGAAPMLDVPISQ